MAQFLAIVGVMTFFGLIIGWVASRSKSGGGARSRPCPGCSGKLVQRGYVSWNGDAETGVRLLTMGEAAPTETFVGRLNAAAASAPPPTAPGHEVRIVGALTLYACDRCQGTFVDEDGAGLRECPAEQWRELGMTGASPARAVT